MVAEAVHFVPIPQSEEKEKILNSLNLWMDIAFYNPSWQFFKIQSVQEIPKGFEISFTGISPTAGPGNVRFSVGDGSYQLDGTLILKDGVFQFIYKNLYREQKRRLQRVAVPAGYPGHFIFQKLGGRELNEQTQLLDIHGDGLQFEASRELVVQSGEHAEGVVRISKFPEVKIAGIVRHCFVRNGVTVAGLEIQHLEFGSEDKLAELILFFRHDVFYFNKNKAGTKA
jgi:hypothetical protein